MKINHTNILITPMKVLFIFIASLMLFACVNQPENTPSPTVNPHSRSALKNASIGLNYLRTGYTDRARDTLQLALQQAPNNPWVIDAMAYYYEKTGEIVIANRYYRQAIITNPESGTALNNYGAFLCRNGKYQASLIYFDQAASLLNKTRAREARANAHFCKQKMQLGLGVNET